AVIEEMEAEVHGHREDMESGTYLFSAQPNAGLPARIGNRFFYMATPDYFADYALRFARAGVRLIGGCCGTTPRHIAAMRKALDEQYGVAASFPQLVGKEDEQSRGEANGKVTIAG